jgi:inhibitor of KinA
MLSKLNISNTPIEYNYLGDHAIVLSIAADISAESLLIIKKITAACYQLKDKQNWIKDIIPAYQTITIVYDVHLFYQSEKTAPLLFLKEALPLYIETTNNQWEENDATKIIKVPVCYDAQLGIDLGAMAALTKQSIEAIIELHSSEIYTVYCIGFMPGFAYMGNVPAAIQAPRHASPRPKVVAGSVGIAGPQTGIYPMDSPGGWQIIGRTPITIFDPAPSKLALFKVGDQVQFYPINIAEFQSLKEINGQA